MEEPRRKCDGSARLRNDSCRSNDASYGFAHLGLADRHDVVDVLANMLEIDGADALRAQSVGQGTRGTFCGDGHDLPGPKALLRVSGQLGRHANDFRLRSAQLDG